MAERGAVARLVQSAQGGDEAAWLALVDRFSSLVWSVARAHRLDPADAADVSQTVWLRLVEHLHRIDDPERLAGWLATTTRNECLRVLRWTGRVTVATDDAIDVRVDDHAGAALDERQRADALWAAVERLPGRCHLLVRMLLADPPPTYDDISEALDMPVGSIGPTRARCLAKLREDLTAAGITEASAGSG